MDMALWSKQTRFEPTLATLTFTTCSTCMPCSITDLHAHTHTDRIDSHTRIRQDFGE